jgi:DNA (cytosine-5)-methyltransferase 1
MLLLENVPGLLSINGGATFEAIIQSLAELGYICEWQVLDSQYFGVPQQRRRVFIAAYLAAISRGRQTFFPNPTSDKKCVKKVGEKQVSTTLTVSYGVKQNIGGNTFLIDTQHSQFRLYKDTSSTLMARMGTGGGNVPLMVLGDHTKGNIRRRERSASGNPCWTLGGCLTLIREGASVRRLTPVECERLQGFPDNWTRHGLTASGEQVEISNTQRYKTLGNAVTTNVIAALGTLILNFTDSDSDTVEVTTA